MWLSLLINPYPLVIKYLDAFLLAKKIYIYKPRIVSQVFISTVLHIPFPIPGKTSESNILFLITNTITKSMYLFIYVCLTYHLLIPIPKYFHPSNLNHNPSQNPPIPTLCTYQPRHRRLLLRIYACLLGTFNSFLSYMYIRKPGCVW